MKRCVCVLDITSMCRVHNTKPLQQIPQKSWQDQTQSLSQSNTTAHDLILRSKAQTPQLCIARVHNVT